MSDELALLDGVAQADMVRRGEVKPTELVEAAINRIEAINPQINAVVGKIFDKALAVASETTGEGILSGVPILLKDHLSASAGDPMYEGMRFLRDRRPRPLDQHPQKDDSPTSTASQPDIVSTNDDIGGGIQIADRH